MYTNETPYDAPATITASEPSNEESEVTGTESRGDAHAGEPEHEPGDLRCPQTVAQVGRGEDGREQWGGPR